MHKSFKNIRNSISDAYNSSSLEDQFFNLSLFLLSIFSIISFASNIIMGLSSTVNNVVLIAALLSLIILYFTLFKKKVRYFKIPIQITIVGLLIASWFNFQGIEGSTTQFIPILLIISIYLNHHRYAYITIIFFILLGAGLLYVQVNFPESVSKYSSSKEQYLDIACTFIISLISVGFILLILKRNYDKEHEKVIAQKKELERYSEEIYSQNERIIEQNELLEQKNHELEELNKTKDKFLSIIGHDLKNPIGVIIGFSELLNSNLDSYDKTKIATFVQHIEDSSKQVYLLLENLLAWANCQTGKIIYKPQPSSISNIISNSIVLVQEIAKKKDIQITFKEASTIQTICDRNMIDTILRNLLSNAIKFTPQNGNVEIIISVISDTNIQIKVMDSGIGMNDKQIAAILRNGEMFTTQGTNNETGTGIGLSLCREFLQFHGSKLEIESNPSEGSCFSFELLRYKES